MSRGNSSRNISRKSSSPVLASTIEEMRSDGLSEAICGVIFSDQFADLTVTEVIGTLELVKRELLSTL